MNTTELFPAATEYFRFMEREDKASAIDVFEPDAVVVDDGRTYTGREQILGWLTGAASEFHITSTWLSAQRTDAGAVAVIRISGDFPGSPVDLRYEFVEGAGGLVSELVIAA